MTKNFIDCLNAFYVTFVSQCFRINLFLVRNSNTCFGCPIWNNGISWKTRKRSRFPHAPNRQSYVRNLYALTISLVSHT